MHAQGEEATPAQLFGLLAGEWSGTYRLWLEPGVIRTEGPSSLTARCQLEARFVVLDYDWTDGDEPESGSMLVGHADDDVWQVAWIDTWHCGNSIMFCTGTNAIDVAGTYGPPDEPWRWRTTIDVSPHELVITAWNITPSGESAKATEAAYTRSA
jgi:hypothetical protein